MQEDRVTDDRALPFQVEGLDVRGRVVTLGHSIDTILSRHDFPRPVKVLVGEAAVLASLLATSLKDVGRFILQTQTDGPVSMIVVDVRTPGQIRATASFNAAAVSEAESEGRADSGSLLGRGTLAMTIEQGKTQQRYQGYVPLEAESLQEAAHTYFRQSEQIPTRIRLAVAEMFDRGADGAARQSWRAGGIIGQFLPDSLERIPVRDLPGGDAPEGAEYEDPEDDDAWVEAVSLLDTVEDHELTDPDIEAERLLFRLFHQRGVRVFAPTALQDRCSCSRERVRQVLAQFSPEEILESTVDGRIDVRCEFCGVHYPFDPKEFLQEN
ncbi:Hsp33 family molecular chaperone [Propylenella binzhouense]|uniref:Hsp33 family molecular chaperone n=1 Tax=Propylenella binzhouense TaxID=2555902 RepID=A0A964T6E0_9HYPH|nr:Hsp33 family molecular chaperone [Propylenella binzhouense]MYZ49254.1 Hsp33 family molecular chaperone [Propylenella binzhouense]